MHRAHFDVLADVDQHHWWFLGRRAILREVLGGVLPADRKTLVIDVGCGTGANIAALANDYGCIGIDTAPEAIERARSRFAGVEFICGRAPDDLGDAVSRAGAVLLMDVLEHVEDDRAVFEPLVRAMQPGALLVLTVPADMRLWSRHDEGLMHFRRYDEAMLRTLWRDLPLQTVAVTHFCSRLYPLARISRTLGRMRDRLLPRPRAWDMRLPARPINAILQRTFAGEARTLRDLATGRRDRGYSRGVALLAILRRTDAAGPMHVNGA